MGDDNELLIQLQSELIPEQQAALEKLRDRLKASKQDSSTNIELFESDSLSNLLTKLNAILVNLSDPSTKRNQESFFATPSGSNSHLNNNETDKEATSSSSPRSSNASQRGQPDLTFQTLNLIYDIVSFQAHSSSNEPADFEIKFSTVFPGLISTFSDTRGSVRKLISQILELYSTIASQSGDMISSLAQQGLNNQDWRVRKESADAITKLIGKDAGGIPWSIVFAALVSRLRDVSQEVQKSTLKSLRHIRVVIGNDMFAENVGQLPKIQKSIYKKYEQIVLLNDEESLQTALENLKTSNSSISSMTASSTSINGTSISEAESPVIINIEHVRSKSKSRSTESIKAPAPKPLPPSPPQKEQLPSRPATASKNSSALVFGFLLHEVHKNLEESRDWQVRTSAIDCLASAMNTVEDITPILPHMAAFLDFLNKLVDDENFKVTFTSLQVIGDVISKFGLSLKPNLGRIVQGLVLKLSDNKAIVRNMVMKILSQLMHVVTPRSVLAHCGKYVGHENPRVREEVINLFTIAFLTFPRYRFDFDALAQDLVVGLQDSRAKVKFVAAEAFAVMATLVGAEKVLNMLKPHIDDDVLLLLSQRFENLVIATLSAEGLVEHISSRSQMGTPRPPSSNAGSLLSFTTHTTSPPGVTQPLPGTLSRSQSQNARSAPPSLRRTPSQSPDKIFQRALTPSRNLKSPSPQQRHTDLQSSVDSDSKNFMRTPNLSASFNESQPTNRHKSISETKPDLGADSERSETYSEGKQTSMISRFADLDEDLRNFKSMRSMDSSMNSSANYTPVIKPGKSRVSSRNLEGSSYLPPIGDKLSESAPAKSLSPSKFIDLGSSERMENQLSRSANPSSGTRRFSGSSDASRGVLGNYSLEDSFTAAGFNETNGLTENGSAGHRVIYPTRNLKRSSAPAESMRRQYADAEQDPSMSSSFDARVLNESAYSEPPVHSSFNSEMATPSASSVSPFKSVARLSKQVEEKIRRKLSGSDSGSLHQRDYNAQPEAAVANSSRNVSKVELTLDDQAQKHALVPEERVRVASQQVHAVDRRVFSKNNTHQKQHHSLHKELSTEKLSETDGSKLPNIWNTEALPVLPKRNDNYVNDAKASSSLEDVPSRSQNPSPKPMKKRVPKRQQQVHEDGDNNESRQQEARKSSLALPPRKPSLRLTENPEHDFKQLMLQLKSTDDWNVKCQALALIQTLLGEKSDLFIPQLHSIVLTIIGEIQNLRTSVSRVAIAVFTDMFIHLGKTMDVELDIAIPCLLKKAGESKDFMVEEVDKTFNAICEHCTPTRVINALSTSADHKNSAVRMRISGVIAKLVTEMNESQVVRFVNGHELEKLLPILVQFLRDGSADTRNAAKKTLFFFEQNTSDFGKLVDKICSGSQAKEVKDALKSYSNKVNRTEYQFPGALKTTGLGGSSGSLRKSSGGRAASKSGNVRNKGNVDEEFLQLCRELESNDWKVRFETISTLTDTLKNGGNASSDSASVVKFVDGMLERLHDGNSKVCIHALQCMNEVVPSIKNSLDAVVSTLLPNLANNLGSSNAQVRQLTSDLLDTIINNAEGRCLQYVVESLSNIVAHGNNNKVKPVIMEKLIPIATYIYATKPTLVTKYILPISLKLLNDQSRQTDRQMNFKLIKTLHELMGTGLLDSASGLPSEQLARLRQYVSTL